VGLKATHRLADFMRELKKATTAWVRDEIKEMDFAWQEGYAAFTVSPGVRKKVSQYIGNQEAHHRGQSFREELKGLLEKAGIVYEEKYLD
jgi:REP element-mobilizing transposase RayT